MLNKKPISNENLNLYKQMSIKQDRKPTFSYKSVI